MGRRRATGGRKKPQNGMLECRWWGSLGWEDHQPSDQKRLLLHGHLRRPTLMFYSGLTKRGAAFGLMQH
jgi:hypothetical protein